MRTRTKRPAAAQRPAKPATKRPGPARECQIVPGDVVLFLYPRHPFYGVTEGLEPHYLQVEAVRDLMADPLDPSVIESNPMLRRGRFLIMGTKADTGARGQFYLEHMRDVSKVAIPTATADGAEFFSVWTVERSRYLTRSEAEGAAETVQHLTGRTAPIGEIKVPMCEPV